MQDCTVGLFPSGQPGHPPHHCLPPFPRTGHGLPAPVASAGTKAGNWNSKWKFNSRPRPARPPGAGRQPCSAVCTRTGEIECQQIVQCWNKVALHCTALHCTCTESHRTEPHRTAQHRTAMLEPVVFFFSLCNCYQKKGLQRFCLIP